MTMAIRTSMSNISDDTLIDSATVGNTVPANVSIVHGCMEIRFDEMEYLPWNNSDNIVNLEVERLISRIKNNVLGVFFVTGVPANIINMMVFYKQGLKDRVNLCLFALSLADGIFLTITMLIHGDQVILQFTTAENYGPLQIFVSNNYLGGFYGSQWVSQILSAIIATERCLCILNPLKFQTLLQTRTMAVIIITVYLVVIGIYFFIAFRYHVGCFYDPGSDAVFDELVVSGLYKTYKELINYLDNIVYGAAIPGVVITVVVTTTITTAIRLRQIMTWRAGTSSSVSAREVALTKMLIGNSLLFIGCITPVGLFRVVCIFFPDINVGGRYQNFYLSICWFLQVTSFINSTFNICVYYAMGSRYRETFWTLFSSQGKLNKS